MSHEAGEREQGDSFAATNGHPKPRANNDGGSIAPSGVDEARSQNPVEIDLESDGYDTGSTSQSGGDPLPRHPNYGPDATEGTGSEDEQRAEGESPPLEPPVTKATLGELDVNKIIHSPKLRHDINFDPALHFRPNLDGEKGRRKRQRASDFWATMRKQLREFLEDREQFEKVHGSEDWCLPVTLKAIREILETLVPQRDRASVEDTFNVDLLMQQFRKGVADLVKLATWLSQLIKSHCAPMRDHWADDMVFQITEGSRDGNVAQLVGGMSTLLGILEAMKLDVANYQIRCLRPLLIEDTIHFEQKFFMRKIPSGRIDLASAHAWFKRSCDIPYIASLDPVTPQLADTWHFMKGLVNLTLPSKSETVPHTFFFDEERLTKLRADMEDSINLELCMRIFRDLDVASKRKRLQATRYDDTSATSFVSSPFDRSTSPDSNTLHSSPTLPLPHHFASKTEPEFSGNTEPIQILSGGQEWASSLENESITLSSATSPLSSPSSTASTPDTNSPAPFYLSQPFSDYDAQVRDSLIAILDPSMSTARWTELAPSLALQILRSTTTPLCRLPHFESELEFHLSNPHSKLYQDAKQQVLLQLLPILHKLVESFIPLSSLQIFEVAAVQKSPLGLQVMQADSFRDELSEIASRIAHIGILHWRVWAHLAYLIDPNEPAIEQDQLMT